jgi:hypothetical protein
MRTPPAWAWRALILMAPVGLMIRALFGGHGVGGGDLELLFYPFWDYVGHSLRHGRLPLWDPQLGIGIPILASVQSQALYPPATVLFTLLPLHLAASVFLFGHFYFAGFGTERLARRLGWSLPSAASAGALVACAPILLASITRPNMLAAVAWLPWTLLAADRVCARRRGGIAALAVCVGMGLLCASPEVTLLGVVMVGAYAVWRAMHGDRAAVPLCLLAGALGVALAAVVLLPLGELLSQSTRDNDIHGMEGAWSFGRGDFASLFLPFINIDTPGRNFREIFYGPFQGLISVIYLGTPAAILGAIAVRRGGRREWLLVVVAALALLLGAYGGQVSMAMERLHLVLFSWRYAVKFIYPAAFVVALLAARGAEEISQDEPGRRTIPTLLIVGAVLLLGAMIGLHRLGNSVGLSIAWVGEGLLSLAAILHWAPRGPWRQWGLVTFCVLDAGLCSLRIPFADDSSQCASVFAAAKPRVGAGRVDAMSGMMMPNGFGFVMNEPGWQNHCLEGNILTEFGLPSVRFYGTPWPQGSQAIVRRFGSVGDGILGVTLMLRGHAEELAGLVPVTAPELAPLWVAEIPGASPRVELRASARVTDDTETALAHETLEQARKEVLLDKEPPPPSAPGEPYAGPDLAQITADRGEQVEIESASAGERYLVLADLYYRGWTASVDGQPAPIRVAYGMVRALRLGPGRHHILFDYHPKSFRLGLWITLASLLVLVVGSVLGRPRRMGLPTA